VKIHLSIKGLKPEDYSGSPHISSAIADGRFTACLDIIPLSHIATDPKEITCCRCLAASSVIPGSGLDLFLLDAYAGAQ